MSRNLVKALLQFKGKAPEQFFDWFDAEKRHADWCPETYRMLKRVRFKVE